MVEVTGGGTYTLAELCTGGGTYTLAELCTGAMYTLDELATATELAGGA
jgi:hypothetical protein